MRQSEKSSLTFNFFIFCSQYKYKSDFTNFGYPFFLTGPQREHSIKNFPFNSDVTSFMNDDFGTCECICRTRCKNLSLKHQASVKTSLTN